MRRTTTRQLRRRILILAAIRSCRNVGDKIALKDLYPVYNARKLAIYHLKKDARFRLEETGSNTPTLVVRVARCKPPAPPPPKKISPFQIRTRINFKRSEIVRMQGILEEMLPVVGLSFRLADHFKGREAQLVRWTALVDTRFDQEDRVRKGSRWIIRAALDGGITFPDDSAQKSARSPERRDDRASSTPLPQTTKERNNGAR